MKRTKESKRTINKQDLILLEKNGFLKVSKTLLKQYGPQIAVYLSCLFEKWRNLSDKKRLIEGIWFYYKYEDLENDTKMSKYQLSSCKTKLMADGILDTKFMFHPRKELYRINSKALISLQSLSFSINEKLNHYSSRNLIINDKETLPIYNKTKEKEVNSNTTTTVGVVVSKNSNSSFYGQITSEMFEKFWRIYPRKMHKGTAKSEWDKLCVKKDCPSWDTIKSSLVAQKKSEQWQVKRFIPYPAKWLGETRWIDNPATMKIVYLEDELP